MAEPHTWVQVLQEQAIGNADVLMERSLVDAGPGGSALGLDGGGVPASQESAAHALLGMAESSTPAQLTPAMRCAAHTRPSPLAPPRLRPSLCC